jgi:DNA replication and repair protein RecF
MGFRSIRVYNFRNLVDGVVSVDAPEVFLVGENGQGKTNLIESIYFLSFGSSFRTRKDETLPRHGAADMAVEGFYTSAGEPDSSVSVKLVGGRKEIRLDDKTLRDRRELIGRFPCIVFCHDDIAYITGPPDMQRVFFNQTLSLGDPFFIDLLRRFTKILKQRNAAVKGRNLEMLDIYDGEFVSAGLELSRRRGEITAEFSGFFSRLYREISGLDTPMGIRYVPSWRTAEADETRDKLKKKRDTDLLLGTSTSGPHRDRFAFFFGDKEFSVTASTGQIRLASLILKMAQAEFFAQRSGRLPILLLDDVLLEMDPERRSRFISRLPAYEQAFFTFLPDERYTAYIKHATLLYTVKDGRFLPHG